MGLTEHSVQPISTDPRKYRPLPDRYDFPGVECHRIVSPKAHLAHSDLVFQLPTLLLDPPLVLYEKKWLRKYTGGWDGTNETKDYFERLTLELRKACPERKKPGEMVFPCGRRLAAPAPVDQSKAVADYCRKMGLKTLL